nr:MAG TPA: hypothetical protein [Caudoviricetes sp.]
MRKIVIHLNDEVLGIAIDDNASDAEIKEQVLEEVIDRIAYDYEEVDEWPRVCTLCTWHDEFLRLCLNEDAEGCNDLQNCEKWEIRE